MCDEEVVLLRGDTVYSQTEHLDRWDQDHIVIHFGYDAMRNLVKVAGNLGESQWERLQRPSKQAVKTKQRTRPPRVKEQIVVDCEFNNNVLNSEDGAEFDYRPTACRPNYRTIVVRKNLSVEKGGNILFDDIRDFFYITNDQDSTKEEIVFSCNDRCHQENVIEQL